MPREGPVHLTDRIPGTNAGEESIRNFYPVPPASGIRRSPVFLVMDQGMAVFTDQDVCIDLLFGQVQQLVPKRYIFLFGVRMMKVKDYLVHAIKADPAPFTGAMFVGNNLGYRPAGNPAPGNIPSLLVPLDLLTFLQPVKPVILVRAAIPGIRDEMCHTYP
jgi:hypothetical protein